MRSPNWNNNKSEIVERLTRIESTVEKIFAEKEECREELAKFKAYLRELYELNLQGKHGR